MGRRLNLDDYIPVEAEHPRINNMCWWYAIYGKVIQFYVGFSDKTDYTAWSIGSVRMACGGPLSLKVLYPSEFGETRLREFQINDSGEIRRYLFDHPNLEDVLLGQPAIGVPDHAKPVDPSTFDRMFTAYWAKCEIDQTRRI